jgi:hypothetical protein
MIFSCTLLLTGFRVTVDFLLLLVEKRSERSRSNYGRISFRRKFCYFSIKLLNFINSSLLILAIRAVPPLPRAISCPHSLRNKVKPRSFPCGIRKQAFFHCQLLFHDKIHTRTHPLLSRHQLQHQRRWNSAEKALSSLPREASVDVRVQVQKQRIGEIFERNPHKQY